MRAMRYHGYGDPESIREDIVERPVPAADEVLVEIAAAGVNPADWKLGAGYGRGMYDLAMPFTPGADFAGVIHETGANVTNFAPGDRVFGAKLIKHSGCFAEYATMPAAIVARLPDNVKLHTAAAVPLAGHTAWEAVRNAAIQPGQRVLIQGGAGGTGTFAIQFAKQSGAHVIATSSARNHDLLRALGVDQAVDYQETRFEDEVGSVDAVIDLVGGDIALRSIPLIRAGGVLSSIVPSPDAKAEQEKLANRHGVRLSFVNMGDKRDMAAFAEIARRLGSGALNSVISETYQLAQASQALAASRTGHVRGKLVLAISSLE